jgi:hypothetical protein
MIAANFIFFWALTTYAISKGDVIGMVLAVTAFLIMHTVIEEMNDAST